LAIEDEAPEVDSYCRQLEAYLCRKNDGHLIRIVGPAFEQVCGWAARGVPVKVAERGIDRYFERYYAKGPRRRPVQIQFCEADVFDVFDEWRRAVGVPIREGGDEAAHEDGDPSTRRHGSLPAHLDRVIARLTMVRGGEDRSLDDTVDRLVRELDAARAGAKGLRGEARAGFLERLSVLDGELIDAARRQSSAESLQQLEAEADVELAPFRDRMAREVYERSRRAAVDRLIRERRRLPVITFD
jgi:hypothetical protein